MCGIAGWLGVLPDGEKHSSYMLKALRHRGPDAHGIQSWPEATLVHTRLSIIDLSRAGAQPMANEDGTVWAIFNGEIYNHRELRCDLETRGHVFKGRSDTEVLPHLYEEEGPDFVNKLQGMFALAIYDTRRRTLLLARDRFGIKPLFYAPGNHRFAFANEIRALVKLPGIDDRPDRQAIYDFAALFYIPAPQTFYAGIRAVQPGEMLEVRLNCSGVSWKSRIYHRWSISPDPALTLDVASERAESLLASAVRRQMESDVPLGALLSGGIDSSLVSAAAQDALNGRLKTFNIRFSEREYDETWAAVNVARHIQSHHETLGMGDATGDWGNVTDLLLHAGQPFADTSIFAVNSICRVMRQHVTVALSGDGGDEGFAGYNLYWRIARIARWQALPAPVRRGVTMAMTPVASLAGVPGDLPRRLGELSRADNTSVIQSLFCWLNETEHRRLCRDTDRLPVRRLFERQWEHYLPPGASQVERLSAHATEVNTRLTLPNDFLFKVDTASMKESLEIRVPMLDEALFAFGLSLPHDLKVKGRVCKIVLREVAQRKLPGAVASKPKKGFAIPVDAWVGLDFRRRLKDVLLGRFSRLPEFFHPEVYSPMVEAFCGGNSCPGISRVLLYQSAIMLLSLQLTLDHAAAPAGCQYSL